MEWPDRRALQRRGPLRARGYCTVLSPSSDLFRRVTEYLLYSALTLLRCRLLSSRSNACEALPAGV